MCLSFERNVQEWRLSRNTREAPMDKQVECVDRAANSAARDRGNDADLVALFHGRIEVAEETDVLVVHEDIHEASDVALVVAQALFQAGEGLLEVVDDFTDVRAGGLHDFDVVG